MSVWSWIGDNIVSPLIGGASDFLGTFSVNKTNQAIANQNIAFQQRENDITRAREDNAVQRAAADMQAAGLSKTLAAGNPASAQALTAPHNSYKPNKIDIFNSMMQAKALYASVKQQEAEVKKTEAETTGLNTANRLAEEGFEFDLANKKATVALNMAKARADNASAQLDEIKGKTYGEYLRAEIDKLVVDTKLTGEDIAYRIAQREHLSKQDELLVEQIATYKHNLKYAEDFNLPTGHMLTGLSGQVINSGNSLTNGFVKWYGNRVKEWNSQWLEEIARKYRFNGGKAW